MIPFEEAIDIIKQNIILLATEPVDIKDSINRVLRQDVISDMDMPPFDKSAMDGYACRMQDIGAVLEVIETIPAGYKPKREIKNNQCSKIMTGAMMPVGADCVIIIEDVEEVSPHKIRFKKDKTGKNICSQGEDVRKNQLLLHSGIRITPKEIASLAMSGFVNPLVSKKPKVGIISTGDEIVEPYLAPGETQIRNTNSYQLMAQLKIFDCDYNYYGIIPDTNETIDAAIKRSKSENDLTILTGGVSMGDFDLVPAVLKKNNFTLLFDKVAIQPGKPTVFGIDGNKFVFGLPGNPVSSLVIFEIFVKEFLAGIMGLKIFHTQRECILTKHVKRKKNVRLAWIPVKISQDNLATPVEYHGSAHVTALADADGIIPIPVGVSELKEGTKIYARQF